MKGKDSVSLKTSPALTEKKEDLSFLLRYSGLCCYQHINNQNLNPPEESCY